MNEHLRWGGSFDAIKDEFSTDEVDELREYCRNLIADARAFDLVGYRAGAIPFPRFGYAFVLQRTAAHLWSLEVVDYPPHGGGGGRMRAARRAREKKERQEERAAAARLKKPPRITDNDNEDKRELLTHLLSTALRSEFRHNLFRVSAAMDAAGHNVRAQYRNIAIRLRVRLRELRIALTQVLYRTRHYVEKFDVLPSLEKRIETTPEFASGMRLESRTFSIGRFRIQLNTWTPVDPGFDQIWDTSLFGIRLVESENL